MTTWYRLNEDGNPACAVVDEEYAKECGLTLSTEREIVSGYDGKLYFKGEEPAIPVTEADYDAAMEEHLKAEREERGYTTHEPSTYLGSSIPRWAQDAADWVAHRDVVMLYGLGVINHYAETGEAPTLDEFKAAIPKIVWTYTEEA